MIISIEQPLVFLELGQRNNNEDFVYPENPTPEHRIFVVCDGMGGWDKGEEASRIVATTIGHCLENQPSINIEGLSVALSEAYRSMLLFLEEHTLYSRMGTTLAVLGFDSTGATIAHIGDSRVYHIRAGNILHQTTDHKYVLDLVADGIITAEQAKTHPRRHVLSKSVSVENNNLEQKTTKPTIYHTKELLAGDFFFLCTDGVLEQISDDILCEILSNKTTNVAAVANILQKCQYRTNDNFSGCLVQIKSVQS